MPLNAICLECESKEFAFTGFNDVAFGRINDQFQRAKLDTQSNKVANRSLINKHKVMGMFCSLGFKFRNLSFLGT